MITFKGFAKSARPIVINTNVTTPVHHNQKRVNSKGVRGDTN